MIGFQTTNAEAAIRLVFNRVLPTFPAAGTDTFTRLCEAMEPFGLTVEDISVPHLFPSRLHESTLEFNLLRGKAMLKVGFGWMDLIVKPVASSDADFVALIFEAASTAVLGDWQKTLKLPILRVTYSSHLDVGKTAEVEAFLFAHIAGAPDNSQLRRDAVQYSGSSESGSGEPQVKRFTFAKSLRSDSAIFFECFLEYSPAFSPVDLIPKASATIVSTLMSFGLTATERAPEGAP